MTRPATHILRLLKWGRTLARHDCRMQGNEDEKKQGGRRERHRLAQVRPAVEKRDERGGRRGQPERGGEKRLVAHRSPRSRSCAASAAPPALKVVSKPKYTHSATIASPAQSMAAGASRRAAPSGAGRRYAASTSLHT